MLDHLQDYPWRAGCGISAAVIAAITLYLYVKRDTMVYRKYWLVVLTLIAIGGVVLLFAALGGVRRLRLRRPMAALTACTALVAALTTGFTVGTYQRAYTQTIGLTTTEIYDNVIHSGDGLPDALPYRYYFWEPYSNRGMAAYLPDRTSFLSTLSPSIFTLYDALGDERHAITPAGPEGTNELLSVGYYIRNNSDWPDEIYTSFSNGHEQINVYQDSHALPIGFCYDTYMTRSEFDEIDPAERAHSMLKTLWWQTRTKPRFPPYCATMMPRWMVRSARKTSMPTWTSAAKPAPMCLIMAQTIFIPKSHPAASSTRFSVFPMTRRGAPRSTANLQRS